MNHIRFGFQAISNKTSNLVRIQIRRPIRLNIDEKIGLIKTNFWLKLSKFVSFLIKIQLKCQSNNLKWSKSIKKLIFFEIFNLNCSIVNFLDFEIVNWICSQFNQIHHDNRKSGSGLVSDFLLKSKTIMKIFKIQAQVDSIA